MRLLRLAIEKQRWDLAAHSLVLATARILNNGQGNNLGFYVIPTCCTFQKIL